MGDWTYRGKIGLILTADSEVEKEYYNFVPDSVSLHFTRMPLSPMTDQVKANTKMVESVNVEEAAQILSVIKPDCIAMTCTSMSFIRGVGYDQEIVERIEAIADIPATTASTASINALRKLGLKKLSVGTPYVPEVTARLKQFLEGSGFDVLNVETLDLEWIGVPSLKEIYRLVQEVDQADADGIYIACTGMRTSEIVGALEQDLAKPVVSAIQATMWEALSLAGMRPRLSGLGRLYTTHGKN